MICGAGGYDTAGLPLAGGQATCPECGHIGPPIPEPVEWRAPWWVIMVAIWAAATNLLALLGSLILTLLCSQADWSHGEALSAAAQPALLALLSTLTLVAMAFAAGPRPGSLRVVLTVLHAGGSVVSPCS